MNFDQYNFTFLDFNAIYIYVNTEKILIIGDIKMNQMIRNYNIESYNGQSFEEHGKYLHYGIKTNQNNVVLPTNLLIKKRIQILEFY